MQESHPILESAYRQNLRYRLLFNTLTAAAGIGVGINSILLTDISALPVLQTLTVLATVNVAFGAVDGIVSLANKQRQISELKEVAENYAFGNQPDSLEDSLLIRHSHTNLPFKAFCSAVGLFLKRAN